MVGSGSGFAVLAGDWHRPASCSVATSVIRKRNFCTEMCSLSPSFGQ